MKKTFFSFRLGLLLVLTASLFGSPSTALAGENSPRESILTTQSGDRYQTGSKVILETSTPEAFLAGGEVRVKSTTEQDLFLFGGNVTVDGATVVGDDLRVAGGNVYIDGQVKGDTFLAGGQIDTSENFKANGEVFIGGGVVTLKGNFDKRVNIAASEVNIIGKLNGGGKIFAEKVNILNGAEISGDLTVKGPNEPVVDSGAKVGTLNFTQVNKSPMAKGLKAFILGLLVWILFSSIASILASYLILRIITEARLKTFFDSLENNPAGSALTGFGFIVLVPLVIIALLLTLVGYKVAILLGVIYLVLLVVVASLGQIYIGKLILDRFNSNKDKLNFLTCFVGAFATTVLCLIPIAGKLIFFILMCVMVGKIVRTKIQ